MSWIRSSGVESRAVSRVVSRVVSEFSRLFGTIQPPLLKFCCRIVPSSFKFHPKSTEIHARQTVRSGETHRMDMFKIIAHVASIISIISIIVVVVAVIVESSGKIVTKSCAVVVGGIGDVLVDPAAS